MPAIVATCNSSGTSATSINCSALTVTSGDAIYINFGAASTSTTLGVSGGGACGSFTMDTAIVASGATATQATGTATGTGTCTIAVTSTVSSTMEVAAVDVSPAAGFETGSGRGAWVSQGSIAGTTNIPCPAVTTTTNNDLILCGAFESSSFGAGTYTAGSGYTIPSGLAQPVNYGQGIESKILATAGSTTPGISYSFTAVHMTGTVAVKP